jgi:hypothetical protein
MKRVAKRKPVVRVAVVPDIVQVRLALGVVPPDIARLAIAFKGMYRMPSVFTADLL